MANVILSLIPFVIGLTFLCFSWINNLGRVIPTIWTIMCAIWLILVIFEYCDPPKKKPLDNPKTPVD